MIYVVGITCWDTLAILEEYPPPKDSKAVAVSTTTQGGGNGGNIAVALARLNIQHKLITTIYPDSFGDCIKKEFNNDRVDFSLSTIRKNGKTGFSYILIDQKDASRTIIHSVASPMAIDVSEIAAVDNIKNKIKVLFTDMRFGEDVIELVKLCYENNIPVLMDCEKIRSEVTKQFFDYAKGVVFSEEFMKNVEYVNEALGNSWDLAGKVELIEDCYDEDWNLLVSLLKTFLERFKNIEYCVVTIGSRGSLAMSRNKEDTVLWTGICENVVAVDTAGCGDAFNAGLVKEYNSVESSLADRLKIATAMAGLCAQAIGTRTSLPSSNEILMKYAEAVPQRAISIL